jgi:hypothetical protein
MQKQQKNKKQSAGKPIGPLTQAQAERRARQKVNRAKRREHVDVRSSAPQSQRALAAAYSTGQSGFVPNIKTDGKSSRIVHREMVLKIPMTVLFATQTLQINPGLSTTFPWLSTQANSWETYRFNSLRFCYFTRVGSGVGGSVILTPDYDPADGAPASELIATSFQNMAEDVSWKDIRCVLNPQAMHAIGPRKYVRSGALSANQDIKTYDVANLFVSTIDGIAGPAGNIWAEYDISFFTPQLPASGTFGLYQRTRFTAVTTANLFANAASTGTSTFATFAGNTLTFTSAGRYNVDLFISAATSVVLTASVVTGGTTVDYGGSVGSGQPLWEDVRVLDVIVGTTIQYPAVITGAAIADINITPYTVVTPY